MNIEGLRYAVAVSETRSFSAAARAYGVTQPALSNGVARLEDELGERLFERSTRGVTTTVFGLRVLPLIERAVHQIDAVSAEARRATAPQVRPIRLGVSPLIDTTLVSDAFHVVRTLAKPRSLVLREANLDELRAELTRGDLDVIIAPAVTLMPRFSHREVAREPVVVVTSDEDTDPLEVSGFGEDPLILLPDACGLTRFTETLLVDHARSVPRYPGDAASIRVLEDWARLGLGTAVLPKSKLKDAGSPSRPLMSGGAVVEIAYEAIWSAVSPDARDVEAVVAHLAATACGAATDADADATTEARRP